MAYVEAGVGDPILFMSLTSLRKQQIELARQFAAQELTAQGLARVAGSPDADHR